MKKLLLLFFFLLPLTPQETKYISNNPYQEITTDTTKISFMDSLNKISQISNQFKSSTLWMNKNIQETDSILTTNQLLKLLPNTSCPLNQISNINQISILTLHPNNNASLIFAARITTNEWFSSSIFTY